MESTGIYWKSLFKQLTCHGFEVYLVNAKEVRNMSGRKTDEDDALWIQKLHICGLLKSSYLQDSDQDILRTLVRYRKSLMEDSSRFIQRIQKSLESMNIKIQMAISDINGIDVLEIYGLSHVSALEILAETETDLSKLYPDLICALIIKYPEVN